MQQNKKKTLAILFILIVLFSMTAVTYAFFMGGVNNNNAQTAVIETGTMKLTFADNDAGVSGRLNFGDSITKLFTLENTGTVEATVDLYWKELTNSYLHGSLMYKLEYSSTENGEKSIAVNYSPVPTSETPVQEALATQQTVPVGTKYYYTLTITLVHSKTKDQTADLQASFASGLDIESVRKYPMLAASDSWFTQGGTNVKRSSITEINIKDSYTPTGTVTSSWDASATKDGSIMAYVEGTKLTIAGNGAEKIAMNPDSSWAFADHNKSDNFKNVTTFSNANLLDTSKTITLARLFQHCEKLITVDVSTWNTGNVLNMQNVFDCCFSLTTVNVKYWNVSSVTNMQAMFQCAVTIELLDLSKWDVSSVVNMNAMFNLPDMFNMGQMKLKSVGDISNWDTSKVTTMISMFCNCALLQNINVSKWDVSSVTNMDSLFYNCLSLTELNLTNWNVSKVENMSFMFAAYNGNGTARMQLTSIGDTSRWNTSSVKTMKAMFQYCISLKELYVSNWNVSNVEDMSYMFYNCPALTNIIGIENWTVNSAVNKTNMFDNVDITLPKWYTT